MAQQVEFENVVASTRKAARYHGPAVRLALSREAPGSYRKRVPIHGPEMAAAAVRDVLSGLAQERFVALNLDIRCRLISVTNVAEGSFSACPVDPRVLFAAALLAGPATSLILAHNHPSGDSSPSSEDFDLTRRLCEAGEILGIRVRDHIVIGGDEFRSIRELRPELFR